MGPKPYLELEVIPDSLETDPTDSFMPILVSQGNDDDPGFRQNLSG